MLTRSPYSAPSGPIERPTRTPRGRLLVAALPSGDGCASGIYVQDHAEPTLTAPPPFTADRKFSPEHGATTVLGARVRCCTASPSSSGSDSGPRAGAHARGSGRGPPRSSVQPIGARSRSTWVLKIPTSGLSRRADASCGPAASDLWGFAARSASADVTSRPGSGVPRTSAAARVSPQPRRRAMVRWLEQRRARTDGAVRSQGATRADRGPRRSCCRPPVRQFLGHDQQGSGPGPRRRQHRVLLGGSRGRITLPRAVRPGPGSGVCSASNERHRAPRPAEQPSSTRTPVFAIRLTAWFSPDPPSR